MNAYRILFWYEFTHHRYKVKPRTCHTQLFKQGICFLGLTGVHTFILIKKHDALAIASLHKIPATRISNVKQQPPLLGVIDGFTDYLLGRIESRSYSFRLM